MHRASYKDSQLAGEDGAEKDSKSEQLIQATAGVKGTTITVR